MSLHFIRIIDNLLGGFFCWVLGLFLRLFQILKPPPPSPDKLKGKAILCQKYFGMGSIMHILPIMRVIRRNYPDSRIIFMTLDSNLEAAKLAKIGDEIIALNVKSFKGFVSSVFKALIALRRHHIDISFDFEFFAKFTLLVSFLSGAKIRVGLHMKKIRPDGIITHNVFYNSYKHISEIYLNFAVPLSLKTDLDRSVPLLPSFKGDFSKNLLNKFKIPENSIKILVNPNCGDLFDYRKWPEEHFVRLINLIASSYPEYFFILIGNKSEEDYTSGISVKVQGNGKRIINLAGKTGMNELFALIENADLMISNDSGPLHISSLYGVNIAAFFGPETPVVYGPVNKNSLVFYSHDKYCSPCLNVYDSKKCLYGEECLSNTCLSEIIPEDVFKEIDERFLKDFKDRRASVQ